MSLAWKQFYPRDYSEPAIVRKARKWAILFHDGQKRKYGGPYIQHPARVAAAVVEAGGADEMVAAAWLHDVVEDCIGVDSQRHLLAVIEDHYGPRVRSLVQALTDEYTPHHYPNQNRAERKRREAERLANCSHAVRVIKRCDMRDNLRDIEVFDPKFAAVYRAEKAYLEALFNEMDDHDARWA